VLGCTGAGSKKLVTWAYQGGACNKGVCHRLVLVTCPCYKHPLLRSCFYPYGLSLWPCICFYRYGHALGALQCVTHLELDLACDACDTCGRLECPATREQEAQSISPCLPMYVTLPPTPTHRDAPPDIHESLFCNRENLHCLWHSFKVLPSTALGKGCRMKGL